MPIDDRICSVPGSGYRFLALAIESVVYYNQALLQVSRSRQAHARASKEKIVNSAHFKYV